MKKNLLCVKLIIWKRGKITLSITIESENIEISEKIAQNAKLLASGLSTPQKRKRGLIDMIGINCAINYLNSKKIKVNTSKSVYKIPLLFEEFKITDIYFGNYRIDVITLYKEKNIKIPKIHVEMDILPNFYFVVQIGSRIKEAKAIGFIDARKIPDCTCDSKFYYPPLNLVFNTNRFTEAIRRPLPPKPPLSKHIDCLGLFLKFMDDDLSSAYKRQLIQHLMNCDSCRSRFIDSIEFEKLANNIGLYPDLLANDDLESSLEDSCEKSLEESLIETDSKKEQVQSSSKVQFQTPEKTHKKTQTKHIQYEDEIEKEKTFEPVEVVDTTGQEKKVSNKVVIDSIFNEIPKIEFPPLKAVIKSKSRHLLIVLAVSFLILITFAIISLKGTESAQEINDLTAFEEYNQNSENYTDEGYYLNDNNQNIPTLANIENDDMRDPISTKPTYSPTVSKVSFEAPDKIVDSEAYTKFLQLIGKTIKLNLQNDLLLVDDIPVNKLAKVDFEVMPNGNVKSIKITYSSGSKTVDNTILKVAKETLSYTKPPSHGIVKKPAIITLILELH